MGSDDPRECIAVLEGKLTPTFVERVVRELLQQRTDGGRGVGALRVVTHLVSDVTQRHADIMPMFHRLKPALVAAVEQIPSLSFLEGG
jgi:hypothetical protein